MMAGSSTVAYNTAFQRYLTDTSGALVDLRATRGALEAASEASSHRLAHLVKAQERDLVGHANKVAWLINRATAVENSANPVASVPAALKQKLGAALFEVAQSIQLQAPTHTEFVVDQLGGVSPTGVEARERSMAGAVHDLNTAMTRARNTPQRMLYTAWDIPSFVEPVTYLLQMAAALRAEAAVLVAQEGELRAKQVAALEEAQRSHAALNADQSVVLEETHASFVAQIQPLASTCDHAADALPAFAGVRWGAEDWDRWQPVESFDDFLIGTVQFPLLGETGTVAEVIARARPLLHPVLGSPGILHRYHAQDRQAALRTLRGRLLRILAASPPAKVRLTLFDPMGLGDSVAPLLALGDRQPELIDGKVWTSGEDLLLKLQETTAHIEMVIQKYLRGEFASIAEYNEAAGAIAEPVRVLVVADFPAQFDERTYYLLNRVIENGPRSGVVPFVLANLDHPVPHGVKVNDLGVTMLSHEGGTPLKVDVGPKAIAQTFVPGTDPIGVLGEPGQAIFDMVVDRVGRAAQRSGGTAIDLSHSLGLHADVVRRDSRGDMPLGTVPADFVDASTWWQNDTEEAIACPIGQSGARDVALLGSAAGAVDGGCE